jgi:type VI secretion system protein ImpL
MRLFRFKSSKKTIPLISNHFLREVSSHQEFTALHNNFKEILKFLREHRLEKLPWHIIIGPEESGKTTLLEHHTHHWLHAIPSNLQHGTLKIPANSQRLSHAICARINQDAVFIEIPGRYLQEKEDKHGIFSSFLSLIKKHKIATLIHGVTLIISFDDLSKLSIQKHQEQIYLLKHQLQAFTRVIKHPINLQIFFSKIDSLLGFNEFFSESLQEERLDLFGIAFSNTSSNITAPKSHIFNEQFEILLKKLNERIVWLLHRERLVIKKSFIADFPQQFSAFKELLHKYIYDLIDVAPYQNKLFLRNICFFSSVSHGEPTDYLAKLLHSYHFTERKNTIEETTKPKSYFVGRLLKKTSKLSLPLNIKHQATFIIPNYLKFTLLSLLTLSIITYLSFDFHHKTLQIQEIQKEFATINHSSFNDESIKTLQSETQALSYLQSIYGLLKSTPMSFFISLKWHPLHNLERQIYENYQKILQNQFAPTLQNELTQNLLNASTNDPKYIYPNLKAYLALKNPQKNSTYLNSWLKNYLTEQKTQELSAHSFNIREINFKNWSTKVTLDNTVILHARSILTHLPKPLLAYLILKGEKNESIDPFPENFDKVFVYSKNAHNISRIYTLEELPNVYFEKIPTAARAAFSGNDVLGKEFFTEINANDLSSVVNQTRIFYIMDYANQWQHIFSHTEIKLATNFSQAISILEALTKKPSPLSLLIQKVTKETTINVSALTKNRSLADQKIFSDHIKNYFSIDEASNRLLLAKPHLIEKTIQPTFINIKQALENIAKASDSKKASFQAVKNEYKNQTLFGKLAKNAFELPQPLSRWLISLISNDWLILLQNTHLYLNQVWQTSIFPEYQTKLNNRYPLVKQSLADIELADFAHFFGKEGTLEIFFNHYLVSFVDTSQSRWQWRELYGQSLSDNNDFPLQLERAALIRKMFFSKAGDLSVEFYLMPIEMGPTVREVQLNIDGRTISTKGQNLTILPFTWPGIKNPDGCNLTFLKQTGEQALVSEKGPWSLFRLLDAAYLQQISDSKHFSVLFDLNGNAARYQLIADNAINPFIPNFISQFNCRNEI